ncbi:MAG: hypothetical protein ACRD3W_30150, partial [Terriglobales bacterium]
MANFFDGAVSEVSGFAAGTFHSAIENPINGVVQIANKTTGAKVPELHLVNDKQDNAGFKLGGIGGMVLDYYLLSKVGGQVMGDVGGTGIAGTMLRAGAVGAVYGGVFTPSDVNSKSFFLDRLSNAAVDGTTFGAMAGTAGMLGKTGMFLLPETRSLLSSMTLNGLAGVSGGLAHAEANAVFKQGKVVASGSDFVTDGLTYGAFGAAFGALDYGYNHTFNRLTPETISTNKGSATVYRNSAGQIVQAEMQLPDGFKTSTALNTQGDWRPTNGSAGEADEATIIERVTQGAHGAVRIDLDNATRNTFNKDGTYEGNGVPETPAEQQARWQKQQSDWLNNGIQKNTGEVMKTYQVGNDPAGYIKYDPSGAVKSA